MNVVGRVYRLTLNNNNLGDISGLGQAGHGGNATGELPEELGKLSSLVELNLSFNQLKGNIPEEVGQFAESAVFGPVPTTT